MFRELITLAAMRESDASAGHEPGRRDVISRNEFDLTQKGREKEKKRNEHAIAA